MFCGIHLRTISQVLMNFIHNICLEITLFKLLLNLPGANELTHCGLVTPYGVNIGSSNGLLPDCTKPLPEPMLTYDHWCPVAITWRQYCNRYLSHQLITLDFRVGVPWELFFADDLVIIATSLEECVERVKAWKEGLESKGLHVNMTKTKFMASGLGLDILQDSSKFPCTVCRTGVGRSSIRCSKCNLWVHYKKCSGLKTLSEDMSYECPRCRGELGVRPIDGRLFKEVEVGDCARSGWLFLLPGWHAQCWWWLYGYCHC